MSTVDDIMRQNRLATQPDDDEKKNGAAAQTQQQSARQTQQQTQQAAAQQPVSQQPQQGTAVSPGATTGGVMTGGVAGATIGKSNPSANTATTQDTEGYTFTDEQLEKMFPQEDEKTSGELNVNRPEDNTYYTDQYGFLHQRQDPTNLSASPGSIAKANEKRKNMMSQLVEYLNKQYPGDNETEEEKKKRIKRERAAAIMAAIGDGISAISNIAFAKRGAQSTFKAENGMLPKWQKAYEERVAKRNADAKERMEALAKMYTLSKDDLDAEMKIDSNEKDEARKDAEQARKNRLALAQTMRWNAAAETDKAKKEYYTTQADLLERGYTFKEAESAAKVKVLETQAEKNKAESNKANRQGTSAWVSPTKGKGGSRSGGGKSSTGYTQTTTKKYTDSYGNPRTSTTTVVRTPNGKGAGKGRFSNFHLKK